MADEEKTPEREPSWKDGAIVVVLKLIDAGLAPWVAVAIFVLTAMWLCMRNLTSKDTLTLVSSIGTVHGLAWIGWVLAFIQIPIFRWALLRERRIRKNKTERLEREHNDALERLKKYQKDDLTLEG